MIFMIFTSWVWENLLPFLPPNMLGLGDLLDRIVENFPEGAGVEDEDVVKIAVIGKPNVGKSSLINEFLGKSGIVSPMPEPPEIPSIRPLNGRREICADRYSGIRRKSKVNEDIERYSVIRAIAAIERCDVCLLMIDAGEGITEQDKKIAGVAHEAGKGIVVVVNKWDTIEKETNTMRNFRKDIARGADVYVLRAVRFYFRTGTSESMGSFEGCKGSCRKPRYASFHRTAQQFDCRRDDDEAASCGQGKAIKNILCYTDWNQTPSVFL